MFLQNTLSSNYYKRNKNKKLYHIIKTNDETKYKYCESAEHFYHVLSKNCLKSLSMQKIFMAFFLPFINLQIFKFLQEPRVFFPHSLAVSNLNSQKKVPGSSPDASYAGFSLLGGRREGRSSPHQSKLCMFPPPGKSPQ